MTENTKKTTSRLYVVKTEQGERLIRAKSITSAIKFVMRDLVVSRVASTEDVARIVGAGINIGDATAVAEPVADGE